jgi:hypothetical protein
MQMTTEKNRRDIMLFLFSEGFSVVIGEKE